MQGVFVQYICELPVVRIMRAFMTSQHQLHLRSIVKTTGLSVGGVADILRRLLDLGVIKAKWSANRKCYYLNLDDSERSLLNQIGNLHNENYLRERAKKFSVNAKEKLEGMDEMFVFFKEVKGKR